MGELRETFQLGDWLRFGPWQTVDTNDRAPEVDGAAPSAETVRRAMAGSLEAFEEIYNYYWPFVLRSITKFRLPYHTPEDLAQEVFVKVWLELRGLRSPGSFPAFLSSTCTHHAISRQRKKRVQVEDPLPGLSRDELDDFLSEILVEDVKADVLRKVELRELRDVLDAAISNLPEGQRKALELHYLEGWDIREIAMELKRSRAAVDMLLHHARETLKKWLLQKYPWVRKEEI